MGWSPHGYTESQNGSADKSRIEQLHLGHAPGNAVWAYNLFPRLRVPVKDGVRRVLSAPRYPRELGL